MVRQLTLIYTRRCPASCRICGYSSSPEAEQKMDFIRAKRWIKEASRIVGLNTISITGGEPMIYFDEVRYLIEYATFLGLNSQITTNAYWASTEEMAYHRLRLLKDAGLGAITVSTDTYHQEFVPVDHVFHLLSAADGVRMIKAVAFLHGQDCSAPIESFLRTLESRGTKFLVLRDLSWGEEEYLSENIFNFKEILADKTLIIEASVKKAGRALAQDCIQVHLDKMPKFGCRYAGSVPAIDPSGKMLLCCSVVALDNPLFEIGDTTIHGLASILSQVEVDPAIQMIALLGPRKIAIALEQRGFSFSEVYLGICDLCQNVLKILKDLGVSSKIEYPSIT